MTRPRRAGVLVAALVAACSAAACSATKSSDPDGSRGGSASAIPVPTTPGPGVTESSMVLASYNLYDGNKAAYDAVVRAFNQSGGILGRQVELVSLPAGKAPDTASQALAAQASCLATAEYPGGIFAVLGEPGDAILDSCLNKRGIAVVLGSGVPVNESLLDQAPTTAGLVISYPRAAKAVVGLLESSGFLTGARRVAIVSASGTDEEDSVAKGTLASLLRKAGVNDVSVDILDSSGGQPPTTAAVASTALKVKSRKPDRIVAFGLNAGIGGVIAEAVKQRVTAPLAAITASPFNDLDAFGLQAASRAQLAKSVVVSWNSQFGPKQLVDTNNAANPAAASCLKILTTARIPADQARQALPLCEELDLLHSALTADGNSRVNAPAFVRGLATLSTYPKVLTVYRGGFSQGRRDGIEASQLMAYDASCKCFTPKGEPEPIG